MRKIVLLCITVILAIGALRAQSRTVTGKVTSSDGSPVPNVTIIVKGTTQGTASSTDGSYSISVPESARILGFSSVGMVSQEISIGNRSVIDVSLVSSEREMQEVVVVGYGTQKKREVTGAIGKIDPGPIAQLVSPSFDKQLAGRTPGLQVTNSSGLVNQPPRIRIRGVNSVNGNRAPLIVLDGVPTFSGGYSSTTNDNLLADINPSDIESIEVLKDGSATAIYGSRASNGVILITTKKGKAGRFNVNYGATFGFTKPSKQFDLLNAAEFITIANEKLRTASLAEAAKANAFNTDTDWQDAIFRDPAKSQIHNLTMEGGTERTNYFLSFNYTDQQGIVLTNAVKRYGVRANVEQKVGKWLKISNLITLSRTQDQDQNNGGNSLSGAIYNSLRALPNVRIYDTANKRYSGFNTTPDGAALGSDANTRLIENNNTNIAYVLAKNKLRSTKHRIINNLGLEIKPFSWLTYTAKANIDYITSSDFLAWDPLHGDGRSTSGRVSNTAQNTVRWVIQNYANAVKNFGDHNLNLTLGTESQNQEGNSFGAAGTNLSDAFFLQQNIISNSYSTQLSSGGYSQGPGFVSYFGRLNYDFAGKYFVQGSFRRDGLSRFAEDKRFGNFPGVSAGYRISNENFWLNSGLGKIFNEFKIRGSWAVVGNDQIVGGNFPYLSQYASAPYGAVSGIAISVVGNSDLEWESNEKLDVGVDFSMFEDRISVTVDYFKNKNNKLVFSDPLPVSFGVPGNAINRNIGDMQNSGMEFGVNATIIKSKGLTWDLGVNYTFQNNKVLSLPRGQDIPGGYNILRVGEPINALYGYKWAGVNSANGNPVYYKADGSLTQGNIANSSYFVANSLTDGALGAAAPLQTADRFLLGSPLPKFFGGINNSVRYKQFNFDMLWRFSGGNKIMNITRQESLLNQGFTNNGTEILQRWQKAGDVTNVPRLWYGRDNFTNTNQLANSRFIEKGDFLRMDNLQVSYAVSNAILGKIANGGIKSFRFFVQGQNLVLITNYTGADPDNIDEAGQDYNVTPQVRTISFGLNVGF